MRLRAIATGALATAAWLFAATGATAQFSRQPFPRAVGAAKPVVKRVERPTTLAEQQRLWAMDAARSAVARVGFLPRAAPVASGVARAVTSFAPATPSAIGYGREWTADDCERSIERAERRYGLPPYLLHAIALTESGRDGRPSPVAMNVGGRPYFATGTADMQAVVARSGGETASIDVGCLQINLKYHAGRFRDWRSLLVPGYNASYAALYLTELKRRYGTWNGAVGAYHSSTPWKSSSYACLVSRRWSQIFGSERPGCGADIEAMAALMYRTNGGRG